ncbi:MAG: hypothetical protein AAF466_00845 [Bacteroidota bacterium]
MGSLQYAVAQDVNQMDANGERHGIWKKTFPNSDQLRYEGEFDHGKEIGTFKFYCDDCGDQPMVVKNFTGKENLAEVQYFTKKGKLVSEGMMQGKDRVGLWKYYHEKSNTVMTRENYTNGKLNGVKSTYYPNGKLTEELAYEDGSREGANTYFSPEGVVLKRLQYINDQLHGPAEYFDANGNLTIKGQYIDGKKHGLWKYYKNGNLVMEETFPKPRKKS